MHLPRNFAGEDLKHADARNQIFAICGVAAVAGRLMIGVLAGDATCNRQLNIQIKCEMPVYQVMVSRKSR